MKFQFAKYENSASSITFNLEHLTNYICDYQNFKIVILFDNGKTSTLEFKNLDEVKTMENWFDQLFDIKLK